ncbi:hypothetical protein MPC4_140012 [Methylocella tundrae]|uniref:Uncharacterized protein n=1 Tax=Methylocella tundrae TaxID=227605 RepID=A0A8B6M416_METTU|nr:hypothetical protein MPC4_140012 [Methylocella tundrae]
MASKRDLRAPRAFVRSSNSSASLSRPNDCEAAQSPQAECAAFEPGYFFFPDVPVFKRFGTAVSFGFSFFGFLASRLLRT